MKSRRLHASLLSLALFAIAVPALADSPDLPPRILLAQAEEAAPEFGQIEKFLASGRDPSRLDDERLRQRLSRAQRFLGTDGLPPDLARALDQEIAALNAEVERRQQNAAEAPAPQPEPQRQAEEQVSPGGSDEVAAFLAGVRPAAELDEAALRRQMRRATELSEAGGLSKAERRALRDVIREARAALKNGGDAGQQQSGGGTAASEQPQPKPVEQAAPQPKADPQAERQARAYLRDNVDVSRLSRAELRDRLSGIRDLLASNQLSPETREALRQKLAAERQVLRAGVKAGTRDNAPATAGGGAPAANVTNNNVTINNTTTVTNTEINTALRDRRAPDELADDELVRRIDIYRDVVRDDRYSEAERRAWRRELERDRRYLRERMLDERRAREARLRSGGFAFEIQIGDDYDPDLEIPDSVFAAEVEDEELIDVLAAPPRREIRRRYTLEDFESSAEARESVARIEIDTVHFGFGEGFLREEEIDKLDRIALVLEKILAKNPDEVFLLEGHTDAVGSDASNLALSRERARAVKEALTTYYVIPADNLRTVGLGERYLKIPTDRAEAENRRVSLARITPVVGGLD
jgi:outer membrane protein OmpA-like peptidoglycan-associated protein